MNEEAIALTPAELTQYGQLKSDYYGPETTSGLEEQDTVRDWSPRTLGVNEKENLQWLTALKDITQSIMPDHLLNVV